MATWSETSAQSCVAESSMGDAKATVDTLVDKIQHNGYIKVAEVVKAGSMGHGTTVPDEFDIDLVVYSEDISAEDIKRSGYSYVRWLKLLQKCLEESGLNIKFKKRTGQHSLQFKYEVKKDDIIDVDLLVSPFWKTPAELYGFLRTVRREKQICFSVSASKWQVQFFKKKPSQVKEYIRRAKAWRNKKWPKSTDFRGRPKSYMLQLLVLRAYEKTERSRDPSKPMDKQTTEELQQMVDDHQSLDIYWEVYYKKRDYPNLLPSRPRIIDPANPSNNLYETGIVRIRPDTVFDCWTIIKGHINTLDLSKPAEYWRDS